MTADAFLPDEISRHVTRRLQTLVLDLPEAARSVVSPLIAAPGKRLRSLLVAACAHYGRGPTMDTTRAGAVVEILHLASLIHDDVVDRSDTRRGFAAAHTVVGAEKALLAGLACTALAGMEAAELGPAISIAVSRTLSNLSYGEMLDVERAYDTRLRVSDYLELVERKTGDLFALSCLLGGMLGGAEPAHVRRLRAFGREVGIAFQVLDDCLDLEAIAGDKPAGTDHLLGLYGAPTLHALRVAESDQLERLLLNPAFNVSDLDAVRTEVDRLGGFAAARRLGRARYARARKILGELGRGPGRDAIEMVVEATWRSLR